MKNNNNETTTLMHVASIFGQLNLDIYKSVRKSFNLYVDGTCNFSMFFSGIFNVVLFYLSMVFSFTVLTIAYTTLLVFFPIVVIIRIFNK